MNEFVICNNMICNNMIILHPVTNFGGPNIVLNFHLGLVVFVQASHVCNWRQRQTDRQTASTLKAPFPLSVQALENNHTCRVPL